MNIVDLNKTATGLFTASQVNIPPQDNNSGSSLIPLQHTTRPTTVNITAMCIAILFLFRLSATNPKMRINEPKIIGINTVRVSYK